MKWAVRIGTFAGIKVYVHLTFALLLLYLSFLYWTRGSGFISMLEGLIFILTLFGCVLVHEFGHALTAKKYGIKTRDIILLPIGGVARLEKMPEKPLQELWVALAGPAVNLVIALLFFGWLYISQTFETFQNLTITAGSFSQRVMTANFFLALFNMLPAFPMDGGRVLRAILALRLDYSRATQVAATVGQAMALLFGLIGLFANPFLLFIALFVWIGAAQESSLAQMKSVMSNIPVREAMITEFATLQPKDPLKRAIELTLCTSQRDFPIVKEQEVKGILVQPVFFNALNRSGQQVSVDEVMMREFDSVDSMDMLETAIMKLKTCNCQTLPVLRNGQLVGLLTMENVAEYMKIQTALGKAPARADLGVNTA